MTKKRIAVYGSTGSIGRQALEVIAAHSDELEVAALAAQNNDGLLVEQAVAFQPNVVIIADKARYAAVKEALASYPIKVFTGEEALREVACMDIYDVMLSAIVGFAGMRSTLAAAEQGKQIALANKESLVVAGDLIMKAVKNNNARIIPVDSEHAAIDQCLSSGMAGEVSKAILTASGGAFRNKSKAFLEKATAKQALRHPTWNMGDKITIDSATLMNKGLEMIEAKWLFDLRPSQIDAVIHPQSIIHSMVEFIDGQVMAQLSVPDMRLPIAYALFYPYRKPSAWSKFNPLAYDTLTFEPIDESLFPAIRIAKECLEKGGNAPCALNAANEEVVRSFLEDKISFYHMTDIIAATLSAIRLKTDLRLEDYLECDQEARKFARSRIAKYARIHSVADAT